MKYIKVDSKFGPLAAFVDDEDYDKLVRFNWFLTHYHYVGRSQDNSVVLMHHDVIGKGSQGLEVDHKNLNKLDNQKLNLRFVTRSVNGQNKPTINPLGYRGVQRAPSGRFKAKIKHHITGKITVIGTFDTLEEAAMAYDRQAILTYSPEARLNFPAQILP